MGAVNINRVILSGNLTADPELRSTPSGASVCNMRLAVNTRRKDSSSGEWMDKPNYFRLTAWGAQGENAARFLSKGSPVAVDGRLEWREWEAKEGGKRESIDVVVDNIQFLGTRDSGATGANGGGQQTGDAVPPGDGEFQPAGAAASVPPSGGSGDDDIPF